MITDPNGLQQAEENCQLRVSCSSFVCRIAKAWQARRSDSRSNPTGIKRNRRDSDALYVRIERRSFQRVTYQ